jgi:cobalt-zinc-cadmium efflux system protein
VAHAHAEEQGHPPLLIRDEATRLRERRNLLVSLAIAVAVMGAEVVGGLLTNSLALLSDAGHMLTDASALVLSLVALSLARRLKDKRRTFGFHRLEILAALFNGLLLVALAASIYYHAYQRLLAPPQVKALPMIGWAVAGLVANAVAIYFLSQSRESLNARSAMLHVIFDGISSVFVIGGGVAMHFTGWFLLDPILSLALATLILLSSFRLAREATHVLLESVPREIDIEDVRRAIAEVPGVRAVHDLHVWAITSGMWALSAHIVVPEEVLPRSDGLLCAVKMGLRDRFAIEHSTLQIESEAYEHQENVC